MKRKRKMFRSVMKRVAENIHERTSQKSARKVSERLQKTVIEPAVRGRHTVRSKSSRWKVSAEKVLARTSSTDACKTDSIRIPDTLLQPNDSSRYNISCRGRKRQHTKVGRPRLNKPPEPAKKTKHPKLPTAHPNTSRSTLNQNKNLENPSSDALKKETYSDRRLSDAPLASVQEALVNDQQIPATILVKRPRGRPRSSVISKGGNKANTKLSAEELQSESVQKHDNSVCTAGLDASPTRICSPWLVKKEDLYYASELRFGAADNVLQEVLKEINTQGVVPKISDHGKQGTYNKEENINSDATFIFDVPVIKNIFENIWESSSAVLNLDTKDLFLALNGLLRPGVFELWRRRLEEQSKKLSRSHMGRLRPNPRPRRYSDMFVSGGEQSNCTRHTVSEIPVFVEKIRPGSRSVAIAAARLTAAKRLIRARSRHRRGPRVVGNMTYGISKKQTVMTRPDLPSKPRRRPQKVAPGIEVSSPRTRRRPDVSHHIDWKFCYAQSDKQILTANQTTPKRRRKAESSPDKCHISISVPHIELDEFGPAENSPGVSNDAVSPVTIHRESSLLPGSVETNSDIQKPDSTVDGSNSYAFDLKKSLTRRLDIEGSADGRRKRRHALTVQRKRPIERPVSSLIDSERLSWRDEIFDKNEPLSDSSINSASACNYDKSFRQTKWILPPTPKPKGNSESPLCDNPKSVSHSVDLPRPRNILGSTHKRSIRNSQLNSYMTHRGRISRRPDRMCRLTLLDRLLLGLNCSVSQNDDEIHVKRLHKDELSILTQRISKTGFSVQSLSVRRNANNDAEYNIVLIFSPNADSNVRRVRCSSVTTRTRMLGSGRPCDGGTRESSYLDGRPKSKSRQFAVYSPEVHDSSRKSTLQDNVEQFHRCLDSAHSAGGGYHSDTSTYCKKISTSKLRRSHSDSDLTNLRNTHETGLMCKWTVESSSNQMTNPFPSLSTEANGGKNSPLVLNGSFQSSKDWIRSTFDRIPPPSNERHYFTDTGTQKRGMGLSRIVSERQVYDSEVHPMTTVSASHGITKRSLGLDTHSTSHIAPFRRHSPRKVIRKVYTGSSTIPKILNRKRPTGSPNINLSVSTGSAPPTSSLLTSLPHTVTVSANACSTVSSLSTSNSTPCVSNSTTPAIIFDEPASTLPVCPPTSVAGFSLQYRRFPTPVMPVTVVPPSTKLVDHSANITAASSSAPTFSDSRFPGVLRFRPVSSIPLGSSLSTKTPERTHSAELPAMSSMDSRRPGTILSLNTADDLSCSASVIEENTDTNPSSDEQSRRTNTDIAASDQTNDEMFHPSKPSEDLATMPTVSHPLRLEKSSMASPDGSTDFANSENELPPDWDGSYTPATSMSASQLLKLKRLHDEAGRVIGSPGESRTTQAAVHSSLPGHVQSSQASPLQGKQTQSIHTETIEGARTGKSCQLESGALELTHQQKQQPFPSQQPHQPQHTAVSVCHEFTSGLCSIASSGIASEPAPMDMTEDTDEFELKSADQSVDLIDSDRTQNDQNIPLHPENVAPSAASVAGAPSDSVMLPSVTAGAPRLQRFPWPIVRPPTLLAPITGTPAFCSTFIPRFHPSVGMVRTSEAGTAVASGKEAYVSRRFR
ncbi:hypothetical protein D915_008666 [Fasciola hepatica]|uniref:Uncharacterized protein n=1 Tax=Fasciola hepatica TaxID=6192 RepID=A0A4E0QYW5_FASHE|nr:hypothetical protein D915_008666 [Fasciola hepatica]